MDRIFLTLLNRSISAGWLILAVMVLRLLLKKAPRWTVCLLWAIAAVRLACPFSVESVFSLIPSAQTLSPEAVQFSPQPAIQSGVAVIDNAVNPVLSTALAPQPMAAVNPLQALAYLAGVLWAVGLAALLGWGLLGYVRLRLRVREAAWVQGQIWVCDQVSSPFILGIFRPRIYLPSGMTAEQTRYVLAHERAHLRRRDHWWKLLGYVLLAVYWFHPLVWAGYILFCRDVELACDERAVRELSFQERKDYSRALLACSTQGAAVAACPLAFGEVGVKARIQAVLRYRKPAVWMAVIGAAVCAAVAVCFLTDPASGKQEDPASGISGNLEPAPYSYEGWMFTYGDTVYDLAEIQPSITSIMECIPAGDKLVVECHASPYNSYYGIFDTASRSFVNWIAAAHFIWRGDNLTTGVYDFLGRLYRYDGGLLADLNLEEGAYIYELAFREDGNAVVATVTSNEELTSIEIPLPGDTAAYSYEGTVLTYDGADYDLKDMHPMAGVIRTCHLIGDKLLLGTDINYYGVFDTVSREFLPGISGMNLMELGENISDVVYIYEGRLFRYGGILLADLNIQEGEAVVGIAHQGGAEESVTVTLRTPEGRERTVTVSLSRNAAGTGAASNPGTAYTPYAPYNELIALAAEALTTHERPEGQETDPFSFLFYMPGSQTYQTMGWLLRDIDGNGTEELIFGENDNSGWDGIVYDIYTLSGGEAVHLVSGWERSRYYLCENGAIAHEGSGGASENSSEYYSYENGELRLIEALRCIITSDNVRHDYYITGVESLEGMDDNWADEWDAITEAQAEAVQAKYAYLRPRFTPFTAQ